MVSGAKINIHASEISKSLAQNTNPSTTLKLFLTYTDGGDIEDSMFISDNRSDLVCVNKNMNNNINFEVTLSDKKIFKLNTATDSEDYKSCEVDKASEVCKDLSLDWKPTTDVLCFLTGTWYPKSDKYIEIYLNFLTGVTTNINANLIYLEFVVESKSLSSRMMITTDQSRDKSNESYIKHPSYIDPTNETQKLIDKCDRSGRAIVGNINCNTNENSEFQFKFGEKSITAKNDGSLYLAFLSNKKIESKNALAAMINFNKNGSLDAIDTTWAKMTNEGNVIKFSLAENDLNQPSEETGKSDVLLDSTHLII